MVGYQPLLPYSVEVGALCTGSGYKLLRFLRPKGLFGLSKKGVYSVFIFSFLWDPPLKNLFGFVFVFSFHFQYPKK